MGLKTCRFALKACFWKHEFKIKTHSVLHMHCVLFILSTAVHHLAMSDKPVSRWDCRKIFRGYLAPDTQQLK